MAEEEAGVEGAVEPRLLLWPPPLQVLWWPTGWAPNDAFA